MGGPFSLRCLSPLCSAAAWVGAGLKLRELGCFTDSCLLLLGLRSTEFRFLLSVHSEEIHNSPKTGASRGTCRATAVCARLLQGTRPTREPRGPSPSGGKTPASLLSLEHPARLCRAVRGQGVLPLARAVAPVVPRRSVRDCYREPDQTREPRGPSPSGGKTPASLLSLEHPARLCRAVRGQGRREEDARRVVHGTTRSAFGRLNFSNKI